MRCLSENANSGIFVSESLSSGQPIPARRDTVVAFLGRAPRGPVGMPVKVGGVDEYLKRFGVIGCESPLLDAILQFFANGGEDAIVVRVCSSFRRHRMVLPGSSGPLTLEAINPGPHELLRASVDYDGIASTDRNRFNLVVHRLASRERPIVEQQEVYRSLSIDPVDTDYIGHALLDSELIAAVEVPIERPDVTFRSGVEVGTSYIYVDPEWADAECLNDYDLIGCNTEGTGLFALDQIPSVDLIGLMPDEPDLGPVALFTAERYCRSRNALLLIDPPTHWQSVDDAIRSARESGFSSPNAATYFPRPMCRGTPSASALGAFAGALASGDARGGVWNLSTKSVLEMRGRVRLPFEADIEEQYALKRAGINVLRVAGLLRCELTGLVTLNRGAGCITEWDDLCLRRTTLFIIDGIARGTRWAAFQDDDSATRAALCDQVGRYLHDLFAADALSGADAADAFYVICDRQTSGARHGAAGRSLDDSGISFVIGFDPLGHGMQTFRFHQHPSECEIQALHVEHQVALAG